MVAVLSVAGCSGGRGSGDNPVPVVSAALSAADSGPPAALSGSTAAARADAGSPVAVSPPDGVDAPPAVPSTVPDPVGWEYLEQLAVEVDGETVSLEGGSGVVSHAGDSASVFTLHDGFARGDLDGDGDEDAVVHLVEQSPGPGVFHRVVPVLDDDGAAVAQTPVLVGDRIVMDAITVRDGLIEVSLFDRAPDEPFAVISRHTVLEIDVSGSAPLVTVIGADPIEDTPLPGPQRPAVDVRFEAGAVSASESATIAFRERQTYTVHASAGQSFTAVLRAPLGVWLDVRLDRLVVASAAQQSRQVKAELPATGAWQVTVVSSYAEESDYELTVELLPPTEAGPPSTTAAASVAAPRPVTPDDDAGVVHLTFDDGPSPDHTPQILDVLARHDARATFFVVGSLAQAHPELIERIVAEGHTVAHHTWKHEDLAGLSRAAFDETITRTQAVLGDLAAPCLRPPYGSIGADTREWAADHGLSLITWDASPRDWNRPPAEEIADYIVQRARPGVVLLMHDGGGDRSRTVRGLDMALERLADRGLRYEPVCG